MRSAPDTITYPIMAIHSCGYTYTIYEPEELSALYGQGAIWNVGDKHVRRYTWHRGFGDNVVAVNEVERRDWIFRDDDGRTVDPSDVVGRRRKVRRDWCRKQKRRGSIRGAGGPTMAEIRQQQCPDDWPEHRSDVIGSFKARDRSDHRDPWGKDVVRSPRSWKNHRRFQWKERDAVRNDGP